MLEIDMVVKIKQFLVVINLCLLKKLQILEISQWTAAPSPRKKSDLK